MATTTTYTSLSTDLPVWLNAQNKSITAEVEKIITDAQDEIVMRIDHDVFQTVLAGPYTVGVGAPEIDLSAVDDLLEVRSISLQYVSGDQYTPLEPRNLDMLTMLYSTNTASRPRFYAKDEAFEEYKVFPTPDATYTVKVRANVRPANIDSGNETNIITDRYPRVMEMAVRKHGAIFMKNAKDVALYEGELEKAILEVNLDVARNRRDESTTRPVETANASGS